MHVVITNIDVMAFDYLCIISIIKKKCGRRGAVESFNYSLISLNQVTFALQIFDFGHDRANFSSVVTRGHLAIRHLLQKGWDASMYSTGYS